MKCFCLGKNVKCALKPLRDERAREMFAHTAAKRRFANVAGSVTLHPKKCNKAKQNRVFASVTLSGTTVPHEAQRRRKGVNFHGKGEPRFRATRREKRGKHQRSVSGFPLKQAKNKKTRTAISCPRLYPFCFSLKSSAAKSHFCQALP